MELPMVIVDVQRGGPVHREADQNRADRPAFGSVRPARRIADADRGRGVAVGLFRAAIEATRSPCAPHAGDPALGHVPSELRPSRGWLPDVDGLPRIDPTTHGREPDGFLPYLRDERLARPWADPRRRGPRAQVGGLEREVDTGNISYEPENHEVMTATRRKKVDAIAGDIPPLQVDDPDGDARAARARMGFPARNDPRRDSSRPLRRPQGGDRAPGPPQSVPGPTSGRSSHGIRRSSSRR